MYGIYNEMYLLILRIISHCDILVKSPALKYLGFAVYYYKRRQQHEKSTHTYMFVDFHGCSVCIKVCPFNQQGYYKIKAGYMKEMAIAA